MKEQPQETSEPLAPNLVAAITIAVIKHRAFLQEHTKPRLRPYAQDVHPERWVIEGRMRQNQGWRRGR